jgi:DNA polymerase-3 subunit epsilon
MRWLKIFKKQPETTDMRLKRASIIDLSTPIDMCPYVVIDSELTGLNPKKDSIISIGALKMSGTMIKIGETFYEIVSPSTEFTAESVVVHGIMPAETTGKPSIGNVINDFLAFCEECVVVGHFISLDLTFINIELKKLYDRTFDNPVIDTYKIHDWIKHHSGDFSRHFRGDREKDLFSIAKNYKIQITGLHNALMDAFITAQLFQRFLWYLPNLGVKTVKELLLIGKP